MGGGGGAGGFRLSNSVGCLAAPVMSPLANPTGVTVAVQSYPIVVGAGGARAPGISQKGANGDVSSGFSITSAGGGGGAAGGGLLKQEPQEVQVVEVHKVNQQVQVIHHQYLRLKEITEEQVHQEILTQVQEEEVQEQ